MNGEIKRPNYFRGQFLVEDDFKTEQDYHRTLRQQHLLAVHGQGVIGEGLQVKGEESPDNSPQLTISSGVAVDSNGQEIVLQKDETISLDSNFGSEAYLVIQYDETETDVYQGPTSSEAIDNYTRFTQSPKFELLNARPHQDQGVLLAKVTQNEQGIVNVDNIERQYASCWIAPGEILQGPLSIKGNLNVLEESSLIVPLLYAQTMIVTDRNSGTHLSGEVWLKEYLATNMAYLHARDDNSNKDIGLTIRTQKQGNDKPELVDAITINADGAVSIPNLKGSETVNLSGDVRLVEYSEDGIAYVQARDDDSNKDIGLTIRTQKKGTDKPELVDAIIMYPYDEEFEQGNIYIGAPNNEININLAGHIQLREHKDSGWAYFQARDDDSNKNIGLAIRSQKKGNDKPFLMDTLTHEISDDTEFTYGSIDIGLIGNLINVGGSQGSTNYQSYKDYNCNINLAGHIQIKEHNHSGWSYLQARDDNFNRDIGLIIRAQKRTDNGTNKPKLTNAITIAPDGEVDIPNLKGYKKNSSDLKLKTNVIQLTDVLGKLSEVRGVSFEWNDLSKTVGCFAENKQIGVIAQEVETVFPELVYNWDDNYKAVQYDRFTPIFIEAIKELKANQEALKQDIKASPVAAKAALQQSQIEALRSTVQKQQTEIEELKAEITSLKALLVPQT